MAKFIFSVAEAKRRFSDIVNQVVYHKKRFVIARRGKPMVGLIPASEMTERTEAQSAPRRGFLALAGLWKEVDDLDQIVEEIYRQRENEITRAIPPLTIE